MSDAATAWIYCGESRDKLNQLRYIHTFRHSATGKFMARLFDRPKTILYRTDDFQFENDAIDQAQHHSEWLDR